MVALDGDIHGAEEFVPVLVDLILLAGPASRMHQRIAPFPRCTKAVRVPRLVRGGQIGAQRIRLAFGDAIIQLHLVKGLLGAFE